MGSKHYMLGGKSEMLDQLIVFARFSESVPDTDPFQRHRELFAKQFCDRSAQSAIDLSLFNRNDPLCLVSTLQDCYPVQGLDSGDVDYFSVYSLHVQPVRGIHRLIC